MAQNIKYFIITGEPGIGKTTIIKKTCALLNSNGINMVGFYTEEVRQNKIREGFDVVSLNGERGRLARHMNILNVPVRHAIGKYGILHQEFEQIALPSLEKADEMSVLIIDEIGKMEFCSDIFKSRITEIFNPESQNIVVATIPAKKCDPIIESIRYNNSAKVWMVTRENRNVIPQEICTDIKDVINM